MTARNICYAPSGKIQAKRPGRRASFVVAQWVPSGSAPMELRGNVDGRSTSSSVIPGAATSARNS